MRRVHVIEGVAGVLLTSIGTPIGELTLSDTNGQWEVRGLNPSSKYHAISYDHTGEYDPVVKMNLIPTAY